MHCTNAIESGFSMVAKNIKNVKNWKNGTMVQRLVSAALVYMERRAHRIPGYRSMGALISEIKRLITVIDMDSMENKRKIA